MGTKLITPAGEGSASARTRPTNPAVTREVSERLTGSLLPAVGLSSRGEYPLDLSELAHAFPLVIYLYPGCSWSPDDRESTALMDAVQHRAFRDHNPDLEAHGYRAIGISSQSTGAQTRAIVENRITHQLFTEPQLQFAQQLQLPTFTYHGAQRYRRLTLVVHDGRIVKVFFPVCSAARSAAQVIAWMIIQGIG